MAELIDSAPALEKAVAQLRAQPVLALDTETDAFFAYRPRVCLLQFSFPGKDLLLDPLAELDLAPVGELLADTGREVVIHAAENDVIQLRHQFGWRIGKLYDTQVAGFVLGLPPYSLAGVLETRFDVKLNKSQQRSDWSRRPLSPEQVAYAADDTRYLLELAADLQRRAAETGRTEEIAAECARVAAREWKPEPFDPEGFRRIAGAKELNDRPLRILRELYLLRNEASERRNRASYRIASDAALLALARAPADGPLPKGVPASFWRRYGKEVRRRIERARGQGPLPPPPRRRSEAGERMPADARRRYERLRLWRTAAAEERGVETFVVARNELLMRVARANRRTKKELAEVLEPFRLREYGDAILAAILDSDCEQLDNDG